VLAGTVAALLWWRVRVDARTSVILGPTSDAHYQIESQCSQCHTPFRGVQQDACLRCHAEELAAADDSHPPSKFLDPRNEHLIGRLDARYCVTCHGEHRPRLTGPMAVTQPADHCGHCHADIGAERPSHAGLAMSSCATAGCHRFHDNRALSAEFLGAHLDEPPLLARPGVPLLVATTAPVSAPSLGRDQADPPPGLAVPESVLTGWAGSAHARAGVNCSDCHQPERDGQRGAWSDRPDHTSCENCHARQTRGFLASRHGMRLAAGLPAMRPELARQPMQVDAHGRVQSCTSCHGAHDFDRQRAAVDACLGCHADRHSRSYVDSGHHRSWLAEIAGRAAPGTGVSCATCHLPRVRERRAGAITVTVAHNQNDTLRPRDKMLRPVCQHCHGVPFALSALADDQLVRLNYRAAPAREARTLQMLRARRNALPARAGE
jgi:hypothetical protein